MIEEPIDDEASFSAGICWTQRQLDCFGTKFGDEGRKESGYGFLEATRQNSMLHDIFLG